MKINNFVSLVLVLLIGLNYVTGEDLSTDDFKKEAIAKHNEMRAKHDSPPLKWDDDLCKGAKAWAKKLATDSDAKGKIVLDHVEEEVGENLSGCKGCKDLTAEKATKQFYDEVKKYDFKKAKWSLETSHFTQLVWKDTTKFCMAKYKSDKKGMFIVVARYMPVGNIVNEFEANVLPLKKA